MLGRGHRLLGRAGGGSLRSRAHDQHQNERSPKLASSVHIDLLTGTLPSGRVARPYAFGCGAARPGQGAISAHARLLLTLKVLEVAMRRSMRMKMALAAILAIAPALAATEAVVARENPLLEPGTLPYQMPPFDRIHVSDYVPAFEEAMREQLREVAAISHNPKPATFDNTIVALDRSGQALQRVGFIFDELNSNNTNDEMQKIDTEMAPKRSAHRDAIYLDPALWERVDAVYQKRAGL